MALPDEAYELAYELGATMTTSTADPTDVTVRGLVIADQRTGPRTLAGPGEHCLLCDDTMEAGEVYLFVRDPADDRHGVAHESCLEEQTCADGEG